VDVFHRKSAVTAFEGQILLVLEGFGNLSNPKKLMHMHGACRPQDTRLDFAVLNRRNQVLPSPRSELEARSSALTTEVRNLAHEWVPISSRHKSVQVS
jgi:hypothetical protein